MGQGHTDLRRLTTDVAYMSDFQIDNTTGTYCTDGIQAGEDLALSH